MVKLETKKFLIPPSGKLIFRDFDTDKYNVNEQTTIDYMFLTSTFSKESYEWQRLEEINKILYAGYLKSALILALTIPDICSKIEYPELEQKKRYQKWFDENVYEYNIGELGKEEKNFDCFNGYMCYLLRCRMVHGDKNNIEEIPNKEQSWFKQNGFENVEFSFTNEEFSEVYIIENDKKYVVIYKSIPQLVKQIIDCADGYYVKQSDKTKFNDGCEIIEFPQFEEVKL